MVTVHDAAPLVMPEAFTRRGVKFHRQGFAAAAKRARLVIAVSEFCADEVATHTAIPRDRIRVVPNGVDRERATERRRCARRGRSTRIDDQPYVFWAGTFQPRKNVRVLLDAFARLDPRRRAAPPRARRARRAGSPTTPTPPVARRLGDRVRLLGPVHREQLFPLFAGADLFAFPSRHEGFGIPVLEAMAQGTAVLCSDIPALREVAGDAARFVAPDDIDALGRRAHLAARRRRRTRRGAGSLPAGTLRVGRTTRGSDARRETAARVRRGAQRVRLPTA